MGNIKNIGFIQPKNFSFNRPTIEKNFHDGHDQWNIEYKNQQGEDIKFMTSRPYTAELFRQIRKYSNRKGINITPQEELLMRKAYFKSIMEFNSYANNNAALQTVYKNYMEIYQAPDSDGGKDLTPKELYEIMDLYRK